MKVDGRGTVALFALVVFSLCLDVGAASASGYGIESMSAELSTVSAAAHPDFSIRFQLPLAKGEGSPRVEDAVVNLPPGLYGNPNLTPRCSTGEFVAGQCPQDAQVGVSVVAVHNFCITEPPSIPDVCTVPIFNLEPVHHGQEIARFGFQAPDFPVFIDVAVRTASDYGVTAGVYSATGLEPLEFAETVFWGDPADPSHDRERMTIQEGIACKTVGACVKEPGGERSSGLEPFAFFTNPSACGALEVGLSITSYQFPGQVFNKGAPIGPGPVENCTGLPFAPEFEAHPTTDVAGAPTGLKTRLKIPQHEDCELTPENEARLEELRESREEVQEKREELLRLEAEKADTDEIEEAREALREAKEEQSELSAAQFYDCQPATATMREAKVTLPEGMAISASAGEVLDACTDAKVHFHEEVDAQCPDASKIGTATIASPALPQPLEGALYQRSQGEPGHLFRLWLVSDQLGLHIKLPGEIHPDPQTGQLTAVFSDLPPVPVDEIDFDIFGGPQAPLKNPDSCGTYHTAFSFKPHSDDPAVIGQTPMTIDEGCGARGFNPQLQGGVTNPTAGAFSPLMIDLARGDGEQDLAGFEVTLPPGELAKLRGVPLCSEDQASGGACPPDSKIGSVIAAAGAGPSPLWIPQPGKAPTAVYLAGPYKGAPYSAVSVVPAQAGPFDLGNVVVRSALAVDPETGVASVKTDPLPQFVEGVPVLYRRLHVLVDRREFSLNPTNCSELAITSNVSSTAGAVAHPSARFQVDGCKRLKFKPKLSIRLKGGTKRSDYPALSATLKARPGDANLGRVSVALPHSEFLAQEHIGTICTRVQFAADNCPKGSVYGHAKAWTPLLDNPLEGPVYLRSSDHPLPDLVMDLRGQIEIAVAGRIDSKHGGIRTTFETIPDAPISKFVLRMRGGSKSLLTNSTDICRGRKKRATVRMQAQNGRALDARPALKVRC